MWEAQFGDFVNGAQALLDQFIAAAESKWQLCNGLVMLLPHGYEGAGSRTFLRLSRSFPGDVRRDNMQVCQPSTPAQVFHLLRRQIHRNFRKPLVMMMPKALLRYAPSFSRVEQFTESTLSLVIDDAGRPDRGKVKRVLLCCGKIFYTLSKAREEQNIGDTAIVRVEQLYPFPKKEIQAVLAKYLAGQRGCLGSGRAAKPRRLAIHGRPPPSDSSRAGFAALFGRDEAASPATGSHGMHKQEEQEIVAHAPCKKKVNGRTRKSLPLDTPAAVIGGAGGTTGHN